MKTDWKIKKLDYLDIYTKAHNNAEDLYSEAEILFKKRKYARSYFLSFTALEEISKSQYAADVYTGLLKEKDFLKLFGSHRKKIKCASWAHLDANSYPYSLVWLGPEIDNVEQIISKKPSFKKRQNSLYVDIENNKITSPKEQISEIDAKEIIHIVKTALYRIWEVTESWGNQIGTKGFMK